MRLKRQKSFAAAVDDNTERPPPRVHISQIAGFLLSGLGKTTDAITAEHDSNMRVGRESSATFYHSTGCPGTRPMKISSVWLTAN